MPQTLQPSQSLDPGRFSRDKAIYMNPNLEEEFWEKFPCKHKQVFGEMKEKIKPEAKKVEKKPKIELCRAGEGVCSSTPPDSSLQNKDTPLKRQKSQKRGEADTLWKHLWRSRKLVSAVKQGGSYFQLLQEEEEQKNEKRRKKEERRRTDLHHRQSSISDSETENEKERRSGGVSSSPWSKSDRRQGGRLRPFTPAHQSLTSAQPHHLSEENVYRQLCCLCWLLEALTLERSAKSGSVASCWDAKDPGRSRNTLKAVSREKLIQAKWDRFISPPKSLYPVVRLSRVTSSTHKSPALSTTSSSLLTTSVLGNMSSCDVTFSGEETECPSVVMSETDPPVSKYLQKLLEEVHQSISKELYGSTTDYSSDTEMISFETLSAQNKTQDRAVTGKLESHAAKSSGRSITSSVFSQEKASMLEGMKLMFTERSQELSQRLIDTLDLQAKKRWMSGVLRYQSLSNISVSRCHTAAVSCVPQSPQRESDTQDVPYSTHWLSALLSSLPTHTHTHSNRKMVCVLEKLKRYTQERTLRIRPHIFLRVLNSLQPWELCCPELCVAIEIVRENAVRMSTEEYDCWLCDKLHLPQSVMTGR